MAIQSGTILTGFIAVTIASVILQQYLPAPPPAIIGIDLGTTYSCVGVFRSGIGNVTIIPDSKGRLIIPSVVAFTESGEILVGHEAKRQSQLNIKNTFYDIKRLIGRKYDESLQAETTVFPFTVVNKSGLPYLQTNFHGTITQYSPEEISAIVLRTLKQTAEAHLQRTINEAVLAVPVEFDEAQRNATKIAGQLAGLRIVKIINEPTAAAMAYGLHQKQGVSNIIVYDMGGGTLDVSLLGVYNNIFEVLARSGDKFLGGEDFNQNVVKHFLNIFQKKYGLDFAASPTARQKLFNEIEIKKIELSEVHSTTLRVNIDISDGLTQEPQVFEEVFTRIEFEELNQDLFRRALIPIHHVLEKAVKRAGEIDEIVLVGGSTRIPKVRELLQKTFGKAPNCEIDPDQAVAEGAAMQAGILSDQWPVPVAAFDLN